MVGWGCNRCGGRLRWMLEPGQSRADRQGYSSAPAKVSKGFKARIQKVCTYLSCCWLHPHLQSRRSRTVLLFCILFRVLPTFHSVQSPWKNLEYLWVFFVVAILHQKTKQNGEIVCTLCRLFSARSVASSQHAVVTLVMKDYNKIPEAVGGKTMYVFDYLEKGENEIW